MRVLVFVFAIFGLMTAPTDAAQPRPVVAEFTSSDTVLAWINRYRHKPDPQRLPAAIQTLSRAGTFRDPESCGVYIGFIAGVIGSNPERASDLIAQSFPLDAEDHWAMVRAIANSGLPDWKHLLAEHAHRMPTRHVMIDKYISGALPTLRDTVARKPPTATQKLKRFLTRATPEGPAVDWALDVSPEVLDMLWGQYFATGDYGPVLRIVALLPWSADRDSVDRLTLGAMAKYTLASNSARNHELLTLLKRSALHQPEDTRKILAQVTEAADTMQLAAIRKEAIAAIEELKRKGPGSKRDVMTWGRVGEGAIALGCIGAAATGQVALGLPCVIGGAVSSAALRAWAGQ